MAAAAAPIAIAQPVGPSGEQPKNPLRAGVWTTTASAAADATLLRITLAARPPTKTVCPSWVPTSAVSATVCAGP